MASFVLGAKVAKIVCRDQWSQKAINLHVLRYRLISFLKCYRLLFLNIIDWLEAISLITD
ncbi:hypothetical protein MASR2M36_25280 [Providencia sp.]